MKTMNVAMIIGCLTIAAAFSEQAVNTLVTAERVETSQINESADPSKLAKALEEILREDDPRPALLRIFKQSERGAGRIYALVALHHIDKKLYDECTKDLNPAEIVEALWYCRVREISAQEWLVLIESGELYRRILPGG